MKLLPFNIDIQHFRLLKHTIYKLKSFVVLRKIARKIIFTREGRVRTALSHVYAFLKAADAASLSLVEDHSAEQQDYDPSISLRCMPRLTVVTMARNESARAHDTMRHFCALFDRVVLIDHLSEDDTAWIALNYNGIARTEVIVLRGEDTGYYQSEYMSACANALIREAATDWIFFLDFDEFLPFRDASSFRQALVSLARHPVIHMPWHNVALRHLDPQTLQGVQGIIGPNVSEYRKIALNVRALGSRSVTVAQGNHSVSFAESDLSHVGVYAFGLFHVPVLGYQALKEKITQGVRAMRDTMGKDATLGYHWKELGNEIEHLEGQTELMREVALRYSLPLKDVMADVAAGKMTQGTRSLVLCFAQCELANIVAGTAPSPKSFTLDTITEVLASNFPPASPKPARVPLPTPLYPVLPTRSACIPDLDSALLASALEMAADVPSVSDAHIPFLFALLEIFRPRRYVELGVDAGASFFAACRHMRANGNYGEAVAVGEWPECPGSKGYDKSFMDFKTFLDANFHGTGKFIRGAMNAAPVFEEQSVDLLCVRQPHSFEEIENIYAAWSCKLAENSVLILHHTSEYKSGFGIWQFFDLIRSRAYASFQFYHNQGIGILAFGSPEKNPAIALLEYCCKHPENSECYFSCLGRNFVQLSGNKCHHIQGLIH